LKGKRYIAVLICVTIISSIIGYELGLSSVPTSRLYYLDVPFGTVSYYVGKFDNGSTYMVKGDTWQCTWQSTDSSAVINACIGNLTSGGAISVKRNMYTITGTAISITQGQNHISIIAEPGTVFESSLLPCFQINGGAVDTDNVLRGISLENIHFNYTGSVTSGHFVYIGGIQSDKWYQGGSFFKNIIISSSETTTPTDTTFIGLQTDMLIGVTFEYINIKYFGVGWHLTYRAGQGSHTLINQAHISRCKRGIVNEAHETCQVWNLLKVMHTTEYGFLAPTSGYPYEIIFNSPQFESLTGTAGLDVNSNELIIRNGMFSYVAGIGIKFHDPAHGADKHAMILNTGFHNVPTAIRTASPMFVFGNTYPTGVTTKIYLDGANAKLYGYDDYFKFESSGTTSLANNGYFPHGLAGTPTTVGLTCMNATYDGVPVIVNCNYANTNSTHVQVSLYWSNSTAITTTLLISYDVKYQP